MLGLVGRLADGWISSSFVVGPADVAKANKIIDAAAESAGRAPESIRRGYNIAVNVDSTEKASCRARRKRSPKSWRTCH
jgi:alkanesulfonate monooxygenase SsuD/methylene tetrahydromethanopterin reductase-like flavin-dependent oxidoreductase (luciferase family)